VRVIIYIAKITASSRASPPLKHGGKRNGRKSGSGIVEGRTLLTGQEVIQQ